jgi:ankyrin repeat protein
MHENAKTLNLEIPLDVIFHLVGFILYPVDYFTLRMVNRSFSRSPRLFRISVNNLLVVLSARHFPLSDKDASKLSVGADGRASKLSSIEVDLILSTCRPAICISMQILNSRLVDPYLLFDTAMRADQQTVAKVCLDFMMPLDNLKIWRRIRSCIVHGAFDLFVYILSTGIPVQTLDRETDPLLHTAIYHNQIQICHELLNRQVLVTERDSEGLTAFLLAARDHRFDIMKMILQYNPQVINDFDDEQRNCIQVAFNPTLPLDVLRLCLDHGADFLTRTMPNQMTIFQYACSINRLDVVHVLVACNPKALQQMQSSLHLAYPARELLRYLIENGVEIDPNFDYLGRAAKMGQLDAFLYLRSITAIKNPSTLINAVSCVHPNIEILEHILTEVPQVNMKDETTGESAIHKAVALNNREACRMLLDAGADPRTAFKGESLLKIAQREGFDSISQLLVEYGAVVDFSNTS